MKIEFIGNISGYDTFNVYCERYRRPLPITMKTRQVSHDRVEHEIVFDGATYVRYEEDKRWFCPSPVDPVSGICTWRDYKYMENLLQLCRQCKED